MAAASRGGLRAAAVATPARGEVLDGARRRAPEPAPRPPDAGERLHEDAAAERHPATVVGPLQATALTPGARSSPSGYTYGFSIGLMSMARPYACSDGTATSRSRCGS